MSLLVPYGYGTGRQSLAAQLEHYGDRMHPTFRRRLFAWLEHKGGTVGIGGGWRPTPSNTSAASRAGHSFHQTQRFASGFAGFAAVDLVHVNGRSAHRAPTWAEVPRQGSGHPDIERFGLHANVSGEPWHIEPVELDGWHEWDRAGRPDPHAGFGDFGDEHERVDPPEGALRFNPARGLWSLWPLNPRKPVLREGARGDAVRYAQGVIRRKAGGGIVIDGYFGPQTERRVRDLQRFFGVRRVDGVIGRRTWHVVDYLAGK